MYCVYYDINRELENKSRFGEASPNSRNWYWTEVDRNTKQPTGSKGHLRAITESEALDRLREAFTEIGQIRWISHLEYNKK